MIQLRFLGSVMVEGTAVSFKSRKVAALLAYLVLAGQPVSRVHLADLFWGYKSEARGRANLSWALNNLRQLVPNCLVTDRYTITFQPHKQVQIDLLQFQQQTQSDNMAELLDALKWHRGELLADVYLDSCPAFELWLIAERERWRHQIIQLLRTLIWHSEISEAYENGLTITEKLLTIDPWREEAHRAKMRFLMALGQRTAALAQYQQCRQLLVEELGMSPSPETQQLYQQLQGKNKKSQPTETTPPLNLPMLQTPFVGRTTELAHIREQLNQADCRVLTLTGAGGMGKTRLALRYLKQHNTGAAFVSLAMVTDPSYIPTAIIEALNVPFAEKQEPQTQLLAYLQERPFLLLLDNYEQLLPDVAFLQTLLAQTQQLKLLITSRERLYLAGEWVFPVDGMPYYRKTGEQTAVSFFAQSARRHLSSFRVTAENQANIQRLCQLVGGMPLALEMAAVWVQALSCEQIVDEVNHNMDVLENQQPDAPPRQKSLRVIFDHTWQRLTEREQHVTMVFAHLQGDLDLSALKAIVGIGLTQLLGLLDKSVVRRLGNGRFTLLEVFRPYAQEQLEHHAHHKTIWQQKVTIYCEHLLQELKPMLYHADEPKAFARLHDNLSLIRQVWQWSLLKKNKNIILEFTPILAYYFRVHHRHVEAKRFFAEALGVVKEGYGEVTAVLQIEHAYAQSRLSQFQEAEESISQIHTTTLPIQWQARLWYVWGEILYGRGETEQAEINYQKSFAHYEQGNHKIGLAKVQHALGILKNLRGQHSLARTYLENALRIYRQYKNERSTGHTLSTLGIHYYNRNDYAKAEQVLSEAQTLLKSQSHVSLASIRVQTLRAYIAETQGFYEQARDHYQEIMRYYQQVGDKSGMIIMLNNLGNNYLMSGDYQEAQYVLQEAIRFSRQIGNQARLGRGLNCLGAVLRAMNQPAKAIPLHEESLAIWQTTKISWSEGYALTDLGITHMELGHWEKARKYLQTAMIIFERIENKRGLIVVYSYMSLYLLHEEELKQTQTLLEKTWSLALSTLATPEALTMLFAKANYYQHIQKPAPVQRLLSFIINHPVTPSEIREKCKSLWEKQGDGKLMDTSNMRFETILEKD